MSEETPTRTARHRSGLRRAVSRVSPSSVKSKSGGLPTRSTGRTTDQRVQDNCRQRRPSGNTTSIEVLRTAATTSVGSMPESSRLHENIAGTKINNARTNHSPPARAQRPAPAGRNAAMPRRNTERTRYRLVVGDLEPADAAVVRGLEQRAGSAPRTLLLRTTLPLSL